MHRLALGFVLGLGYPVRKLGLRLVLALGLGLGLGYLRAQVPLLSEVTVTLVEGIGDLYLVDMVFKIKIRLHVQV